MDKDYAELVERLRGWDRCYPGNINIERATDEAADAIEALQARAEKAEKERDGLRWHLHQCEQIAGRTLGYPWYKDDPVNFPDATDADGVCIGDHIGDTIVAELATRLKNVKKERDEARALLRKNADASLPISRIG